MPLQKTIILSTSDPAEAQNQSILTITEKDEDGGTVTIEDSHRFIDLNSHIAIELDKELLADHLETDEELFQKLSDAQQLGLLTDEVGQAIRSLQQAYNAWLETENEQIYRDSLSEVAKITLRIFEILDRDNMPEVYDQFDAVLTERIPVIKQYQRFFDIIDTEYRRILAEVETIIDDKSTFIAMGGWIIHEGQSRPIHLPHFDEYSEQEFYRADRFREAILKLSGAHEEMLRQFKDRNQPASFADATQTLVSNFKSSADQLESQLKSCLNTFRDETDTMFKKIAAEVFGLKSDFHVFNSQFGQYLGQLETLIDNIVSVENIRGDRPRLNEIILSVQPLVISTENVLASLTTFADSVQIRFESLEDFNSNQFRELVDECSEKMSNVLDFDRLLGSFRAGANVNASELHLGEEVLQHSLDQLPSSTTFSLNYAGYREPGDYIVFKLVSGRQGEKPADVEVRQLRLERILPHLKLAPGLLYARPKNNDTKDIAGAFHVAPSYSILLKWDSRESSFINQLLQPGVGLNISAIDFNRDNTPELGIALVGSVFLDYIQVGYGYNLNVETNFFSLGLRLPLASMTLASDRN